jgi:multidrug efflux pump subunit AcrB
MEANTTLKAAHSAMGDISSAIISITSCDVGGFIPVALLADHGSILQNNLV